MYSTSRYFVTYLCVSGSARNINATRHQHKHKPTTRNVVYVYVYGVMMYTTQKTMDVVYDLMRTTTAMLAMLCMICIFGAVVSLVQQVARNKFL